MNLLLISEIREGLTPPGFGGEFVAHIERKTNPAVRAASLTAWNLLAEGLGKMGYAGLEQESSRLGEAAPEDASAPAKITLLSKGAQLGDAASECASAPAKITLLSEGAQLGDAASEGASAPAKATLMQEGTRVLPSVRFRERGKPEFIDCPLLHFSLAHSGKLAAALLSSSPCGVDVERIRPEVDKRLRARCLSEEEQRLGMDFFECWVKKECVGKLDGRGIDAHPGKIDTLDARWAGRFFLETLVDSSGQSYALAALCEEAEEISPCFVWKCGGLGFAQTHQGT